MRYGRARLSLICAGLTMALGLGGCDTLDGWFGGSGSGNPPSTGAASVAGNGTGLASAFGWVAGPTTTYCQKPDPTQVYTVTDAGCAPGDRALKSWDYNRVVADNEARAAAAVHAEVMAEAAKPTYCRTAISHTAYRSASRQCQPGEETISEQDYAAARAEAEAAATRMP